MADDYEIFDLSKLFHPDHNIVKPDGPTLNGKIIDFNRAPSPLTTEPKAQSFDVNDPEYREFMEEAIATFRRIQNEDNNKGGG